MVYQSGKHGFWWYRFRFGGRIIHESARTQSKTVVREAEKQRRRQLEESWNQITRRTLPPTFERASQEWLNLKRPHLAQRSVKIEAANLKHLLPSFAISKPGSRRVHRPRRSTWNWERSGPSCAVTSFGRTFR
jgi:hypothetical protein